MSSSHSNTAEPLPVELEGVISLNAKYQVLICPSDACRKAVAPTALSEHLRTIHKTKLELRRQVESYIEQLPYRYDYKTVRLPPNGSSPQPILPVLKGLQCLYCYYKSISRVWLREHCNKDHKLQRKKDEELFTHVKLQSWFQDRRQRY